MDNRTRFQRLMSFGPVDRLPVVEWAVWWDKTIERWRGEGLPDSITDPGEIREYLGLDMNRQMCIGPRKASLPAPEAYGRGIVATMDEYQAIKPHLYPDPEAVIDRALLESWAERQAAGDTVVWLTLEDYRPYARLLREYCQKTAA